jgi:crotonobetainyl-CoA:carnitine CoA-transferase CaiB-like acyl-CoA transferase
LQTELREIFRSKTSAEWMDFGGRVNTPIAPVNSPKTLPDDPQFQARLGWIPADRLGAEQLPFPVNYEGEEAPVPTKAPTLGEHTAAVLREVCEYDEARMAELRSSGALG